MMNIRPIVLKLALAVVMMALPFTAAMAATSSQEFVQNASIGNQFEISSSRLALQNTQNSDVRQFAQQMIDDHTKVSDQLKAVLASGDGSMAIKQPSPGLDPLHRTMLDKLKKASGNAFDKQYIKAQVDAHNEAVALFRDYAQNGDNPALKSFALQNLPTLEAHQKRVMALKAAM